MSVNIARIFVIMLLQFVFKTAKQCYRNIEIVSKTNQKNVKITILLNVAATFKWYNT